VSQTKPIKVNGTSLEMIIFENNSTRQKFVHISTPLDSRDVNLVDQTKAGSFQFDFLPNDLACYHHDKQKLTLAYCTTTNMLVYADKKPFKILESN